ncbi:hypothetical protein LS633_25425 [Pseudomonas sp. NIBR-H-19]|uniref:hypothetical protein n=1 Tax=Pseudomonas sp. NIBR-H-19 TaxID=2901380 RepID=UPI001E2CABE4|nr:hypothetical protein [Pseudomonas sp. NIBR-H-19]UHC81709.1 hypothetical protein LS633_25425 [Pseudomonas sp. NIBR-H-19]
MYQQQYWTELYELKCHQKYLALHQERAEGWERRIKVFMAVVSSTSIGGWALWNELAPLWATLIAASQVVTAIYAFLPFKSRIKPISLAVTSLTVLFDQAEHGWFAVAEGDLTDSQVNDARYKIRKSKTKIMSDTVGVLIIPHDLDLMRTAEQEAMAYFKNYHPRQEDDQ